MKVYFHDYREWYDAAKTIGQVTNHPHVHRLAVVEVGNPPIRMAEFHNGEGWVEKAQEAAPDLDHFGESDGAAYSPNFEAQAEEESEAASITPAAEEPVVGGGGGFAGGGASGDWGGTDEHVEPEAPAEPEPTPDIQDLPEVAETSIETTVDTPTGSDV